MWLVGRLQNDKEFKEIKESLKESRITAIYEECKTTDKDNAARQELKQLIADYDACVATYSKPEDSAIRSLLSNVSVRIKQQSFCKYG